MAIGSHHADGVSLNDEESSSEVIASVLHGDGETRLGDEPAHHGGGKGDLLRTLAFGESWKIVLRESCDLVVRSLALDRDKPLLVILQKDVGTGGEGLHDVVKLPRRQGGGSRLLDARRACGFDGHIEVGRRQREGIVRGDEERIGKNGDRPTAVDDSLNHLKIPDQIFTADGYFHGLLSKKLRERSFFFYLRIRRDSYLLRLKPHNDEN